MLINRYKYFIVLTMMLLGCTLSNASKSSNVLSTPTVLIAPSNTSLPTNTMIPSHTPTSLPTLIPEKAHELLKELLWNNPECTLPCFMGITPAQTTLEEINTLFSQTDPFYYCELDDTKNGRCHTSFRFDTGLAFDFRITINSGIVENMQIPVTLPNDQSISARKEWSAITPASLVKQYGVPSKVEIFMDLGAVPSYIVDIYFDDIGVIYEYQSYELRINDLRICPNRDTFEYIRLWSGMNPINPPFAGVPLEQSADMTIEEFVEILITDTNGACFTLNKEASP